MGREDRDGGAEDIFSKPYLSETSFLGQNVLTTYVCPDLLRDDKPSASLLPHLGPLYDGERWEEKEKNKINFTGTNSFTFECQNKHFAKMIVII